MENSLIAGFVTMVAGVVVCLVIVGLVFLVILYCCTNHKPGNGADTDVEQTGYEEPVYTVPWQYVQTNVNETVPDPRDTYPPLLLSSSPEQKIDPCYDTLTRIANATTSSKRFSSPRLPESGPIYASPSFGLCQTPVTRIQYEANHNLVKDIVARPSLQDLSHWKR